VPEVLRNWENWYPKDYYQVRSQSPIFCDNFGVFDNSYHGLDFAKVHYFVAFTPHAGTSQPPPAALSPYPPLIGSFRLNI